MSYKRTVHCSYCYNTGHNRRGCPDLKKFIKENPDSYVAKRAESRKASQRPRKCSYCATPGHTRRTCEKFKTNRQIFIDDALLYRRAFKAWADKVGLGIGALVEYEGVQHIDRDGNWTYDNDAKVLMMVTHLDADDHDISTHRSIVSRHALSPLIGRPIWMDATSSKGRMQLRLPEIPGVSPATFADHWDSQRQRGVERSFKIVSPAPGEIPESYLSLDNIVAMADEVFKPKAAHGQMHYDTKICDEQRAALVQAADLDAG